MKNNNSKITDKLSDTVKALSDPESYKQVYHVPKHDKEMPSTERLKEMVDLLREILFPGYYGNTSLKVENMPYYVGVNVNKVFEMLVEQIHRGLCFACLDQKKYTYEYCSETSRNIALKFIAKLPQIRELLVKDVKAAYDGDPAAKSLGEIIYCYPAIRTLTNYRIAHELLQLEVPLIPRIITEMAHSETGVDIHPGATIGEYFAIDHGTGIVIGETCIIGNHVKLYQGVTLGAKSFPLDEKGNPIKGIPRHPIVEDHVIIYAGATILGRITIGRNSVIGGNVWVTNNIAPGSKIIQHRAKESLFIDGGGI